MTRRNGQAALEYLFTYGWALLAILVTLGTLTYFGAFDFASFRSSGCQFPPGISCEDYYIGDDISVPTGEVRTQVRNTFGADIEVTSITPTDSRGTFGPCSRVDDGPAPFDWDRDIAINISCPFNAATYADGQSYDVTMRINFTQQGETYEHSVIGRVSGEAQ